jgi:hypothetical protein
VGAPPPAPARGGAAARRATEEKMGIDAMVRLHEAFYRRATGWEAAA